MKVLSTLVLAGAMLVPGGRAQQSSAELNSSTSAFVEDPALLWSTYTPQLYFGIRPRLPKSITNGLMWFGLNDWEGLQRVHHTTSSSPPHENGLESYTYTSHIPRVGNTQRLLDSRNKVRVDTSFVNLNDGKDWGARVEMNGAEDSRTSGVWYIAIEGEGGLRLVEQEDEKEGLTSPIVLLGNTPDLGSFRIVLTEHNDAQPITTGNKAEHFVRSHERVSFAGSRLPEGDLWKAKDIVATLLSNTAQRIATQFSKSTPPDSRDLPDPAFVLGRSLGNQREAFQNNFWAFQFSSEGNGGWDVAFESGQVDGTDRAEGVQGRAPSITSALANLESRFASHFVDHLPIPSTSPYSSAAHLAFAQEVTSNLLGGIGYFHGRSLIDRSFAHEYDDTPELEDGQEGGVRETEERSLLTATPSRSFFPRGFYWDEGFHLLVVGEWDQDLSLEILKSWVDLIDEDGWVGREQILGEEARSKVPAEFRVQYPTNANPPTLAMAVTSFITRLKEVEANNLLSAQLGLPATNPTNSRYLSSPSEARSYLLSIYPALRRHYLWFRRTQKGQLKEWGRRPPSRMEAYRWRGRTEHHVLTSGLDDYPRALPPHVGELHVDLISWMGFFARTMGEIAEYLEIEDDLAEYQRNEKNVIANIDALHWSEDDQMYCDATVDEDDESTFVCHSGYISLFPFLTGMLPATSPNLGAVLDLMRDPTKLWSEYGIRSLSKDHPLFGQGENYWRGPIWMPFNYMALSSLYKIYMPHPGPHQARATEIYNELRENIINNIFNEYQRTGFVWEQYDPLSGSGSRSHPFTGWTSLVAMIMAEKY